MAIACERENEVGRFLRMRQRLIYPGAILHITQRAPGSELIFIEESDYKKFIGLLKFISQKFEITVFSFALLPNHLHLLLMISKKNLSEAMKALFESYAQYINKKYERKGHVFCGVFRSTTCLDDSYFLTASIYIHLNAVRAGCCVSFDDYRWQTTRLYIDPEAPFSFVKTDKVLTLLSQDQAEARRMYNKALEKSLEKKAGHSTDHVLIDKRIRQGIQAVRNMLRGKNAEEPDLAQEPASLRKDRPYVIKQLLANGCSSGEIQSKLGISQATYYRILGNPKMRKNG
jgi:putative transposase